MFKKNVGKIDRTARIIIGSVLIVLTLTNTIGLWGWIGIIPIITGSIRSCVLYTLLGINTNKLN